MRITLPVLVLALAAPSARALGPTPLEKAEEVVGTAKSGMRCNGSSAVGPELMQFLDKAPGVSVIVAAGGPLIRVDEIDADIPVRTIVFNPLIGGASPRYAAYLLAEKAAELKLADMPDTAEKRFMVLSYAARAWLELGGQRAQLPDFDGVRDPKTADKIEVWTSNSMAAYVRDQGARGVPTLDSLIRTNGAKIAASQVQVALYTQRFMLARDDGEERGWLAQRDQENARLAELVKIDQRLKEQQAEARKFQADELDWLMANAGTMQ